MFELMKCDEKGRDEWREQKKSRNDEQKTKADFLCVWTFSLLIKQYSESET